VCHSLELDWSGVQMAVSGYKPGHLELNCCALCNFRRDVRHGRVLFHPLQFLYCLLCDGTFQRGDGSFRRQRSLHADRGRDRSGQTLVSNNEGLVGFKYVENMLECFDVPWPFGKAQFRTKCQ